MILSTTVPTRSGYTFLGWSTSSTATSAEYQPGDSYSDDSSVTLYAVWKNQASQLYSNTSNNARITTAGTMAYFEFTPTESCKYVIYSNDSNDPRVYLYSSDGSLITSDDDSGDGTNFRLAYTLQAGTKYKYGIRYYSSSRTGSIAFLFGKVFTITYNSNGGSGAPSSQSKDYGKSVTLSSTVPTRDGYEFLGWDKTSSATGAVYFAGDVYADNADVILYAVWEVNEYTVVYDANGGSGAPSSQIKTHGIDLILESTVPTRDGYTFCGWSTSSTATNAEYQPGDSYLENVNATLYAVWEKEYLYSGMCGDNLTWMLDENGVLTIGGSGEMYDFSIESHGSTAPWYSYDVYTVLVEDGVTSIGENAFYFKDVIDISFGKDVESISPSAFLACMCIESFSVDCENNFYSSDKGVLYNKDKTILVFSPGGEIPNTVKSIGENAFCENYYMSSLYVPDSVEYIGKNAFSGLQILTSITLGNGIKNIDEYAFGGCISLKSISFPNGIATISKGMCGNCWELEYITLPNTITKIEENAFLTCYKLSTIYYEGSKAEWNNIQIENGNDYVKTATVVYGRMTVEYNANGGSGAPSSQTKTHGTDLILNSTVPTRDGYVFCGWSTSSAAESVEYLPGGTYSADQNVTLYAVWEPIHTQTAVTQSETGLICTVELIGIPESSQLWFATYNEGKLVHFESRIVTSSKEVFTVAEASDTVKVFVFDGTSLFNPITDCEVINNLEQL